MREGDVTPIAGKNRQRVERDGDAGLVTQLTRDVLAFADERFRRGVIALLAGKHASGKKRARARFGGSRGARKLQQLAQPVPAFGEIFANLPETKQRGAETQAPLRVSGFCQPF